MLLLLSILLPALTALAAFRLSGDARRRRFTALALPACALFAVAAAFLSGGDVTLLRLSGTLSLCFGADALSRFFVVLVSVIWCLVQLHAFGYMPHEGKQAQFFGFFLLTYAALLALALARNAATLYMCFELMTLCSMPLVLHSGTGVSRDAALKYLGYSSLGAALALLGFFLLAAAGNPLDFVPGGRELTGERGRLLAAAFLIVLGFGAKAGLVPLQMWLTEAHPVAPSPASAVLSGLITKGGVIAILRAVFWLFGADFLRGTWVQTAVLALSTVTIFTGSMLALREKLLKKRLAYSTVSNVSYILFGLFSFTAAGFFGAMLQLAFHALAKDVLFLSAGSVILETGKTRTDELRGIGRRMPVTMGCFTLASLSLIGIPPAGGYAAKWYLALGALEGGGALGLPGLAVLMVSALLTAFYLLPIVSAAFFPGRDFEAGPPCEAPQTMLLPVMLLASLIILLAVLPPDLFGQLAALVGRLL